MGRWLWVRRASCLDGTAGGSVDGEPAYNAGVLVTDVNTLSEADHRRHLRRAVLASTVGTAIEWYDFFLYSTVTGLVFARLYFPHADHLTGTLEAFGVYAVG